MWQGKMKQILNTIYYASYMYWAVRNQLTHIPADDPNNIYIYLSLLLS